MLPQAAATSREHSVRQMKVADAVEQQLRLLLGHPGDVSSGRSASGRRSAALEEIALQEVEINGDLSVATVWWRLKAEERLCAADNRIEYAKAGVYSTDGESTHRLSHADLQSQRQAANKAIKSNSGWMRRRLGSALSLRKVPVLQFKHADVGSGEHRSGRRKKTKKRQPKQQRAQHIEAAFAAIANERNGQDQAA